MTTLHWKNAYLYMGTGTAVPIAEAVEATLNIEFDTVVDSAWGDTWETKLKGALRHSGSASGNFDSTSTALFDFATQTSICNFYLYPDRSTPTRYYYGQCWPNWSLSAGRTNQGTVSVAWEGSGQLAQN